MEARESDLPLHFVALSTLWSAILKFSPKFEGDNMYLSLVHSILVTMTSLLCIFQGYDTAFTCAASISFFVVDWYDMAVKDGLLFQGSSDSSKGNKSAKFSSLRLSRKMDYIHHALGITFGLIQHYYENDLCSPHVGNAFIYVQWNEVSTPFYNMFRLTHSIVWGGIFALTFFLARVVGNTFIVIPLLYQNCDSTLGFFCAPYFLLQYVWFYLIVKKITKTLGEGSSGPDKERSKKGLEQIKTD